MTGDRYRRQFSVFFVVFFCCCSSRFFLFSFFLVNVFAAYACLFCNIGKASRVEGEDGGWGRVGSGETPSLCGIENVA